MDFLLGKGWLPIVYQSGSYMNLLDISIFFPKIGGRIFGEFGNWIQVYKENTEFPAISGVIPWLFFEKPVVLERSTTSPEFLTEH